MSVNRENVIWQSKDGTWNRGFFEYWQTGPDFEWDVEYDTRMFHWVSTGHATAGSARQSWPGANPGGYWEIGYEGNEHECDMYDTMAAELEATGGSSW